MQRDQIVLLVTMELKQTQPEVIVQNAQMVPWQMMLLIQIARDVPVESKHWEIDRTVHCIIELTIDVPMALKQMLPEAIVTDAYIQWKLLWDEPTATTALMELNQLMLDTLIVQNAQME